MFCPNCAIQITSSDTKFCSNCGFVINVVRNIVDKNGKTESELSKFQIGLRAGVKLLLLAVILFPIFQILGGFFVPDDKLVESSPSSSWFDFLGNAILFALVLSACARIFYAIVFERISERGKQSENFQNQINSSRRNVLPPSDINPASNFGKWRVTDELFEPVFNKRKTSGE